MKSDLELVEDLGLFEPLAQASHGCALVRLGLSTMRALVRGLRALDGSSNEIALFEALKL